MANYDGDRCRRRARIAAIRDGVDATHVHFFRGDSAYREAGSRPAHGVARIGVIPTTPESAVRLINASLAPALGKGLGLDDVYIHYVEAANSRFIGDRFMFLDASTLRNIANAAGSGFAFMNSHRTGGLSSPSELPFGRTFAGRYEEFADQTGATFGRAVVGLYMLKGVHPNGSAGPSTDDLHRSIEAGTLSDVSMGLVGGLRVCDVCGEDLAERDPETGEFHCPHAPGTHRELGPENVEAQTARGVRGGKASYTLVDAMPQELSAVYKGAVPGAGFRKALALSMAGGLNAIEASEARESYAQLLERGDRTFGHSGPGRGGAGRVRGEGRGIESNPMLSPTHAPSLGLSPRPSSLTPLFGGHMDFLRAFRFWQAAGEPAELNFESLAADSVGETTGPFGTATVEDHEKVQLRLRVAELEELARGAVTRGLRQEADAFIHAEISAGRVVPAEADRLVEVYVQSGLDDAARPLKAIVGRGEFTRLAYFKRGIQARKPHALTKEEVGTKPILPTGARPLANSAEPPNPRTTMKPERLAEMLAATPQGRPVLATLAKKPGEG